MRQGFRAVGWVVLPTYLLAAAAGCSTIADGEVEVGEEADHGQPLILRESVPTGGLWSQWRGPGRDGRYARLDFRHWQGSETLPKRWEAPVGIGVSSPVLSSKAVFCHSRVGDDEVVTAVDLGTGAPLWRTTNPITAWDQPWEAAEVSSGPIATPVFVDGRLYTIGIHGYLQCLDAENGTVLFRHRPNELLGVESYYRFGHAASPLVHKGRLYIYYSSGGGGVIVLDAKTGALLWRLPETVAYTSPLVATIDGQEHLIVRAWGRIVGLDPVTGEVLWEHEAEARGIRRDCATPTVVDDVVYVTNRFHGTISLRIQRDGERWRADRLFRSGSLSGNTGSPVFHKGYLYGLHKRSFFACMDARTGERKWVAREFGSHLSLMLFGDQALALDENGRLAQLTLSPQEFKLEQSWKIGDYTWAHPAVSQEVFVYRDGEALVCITLNEEVTLLQR